MAGVSFENTRVHRSTTMNHLMNLEDNTKLPMFANVQKH